MLAALSVLAILMSLEPSDSSPQTSAAMTRVADVEFALKPATSREAKSEIAISLGETGMVERVVAPASSFGFYRVYLRQPNNLLQMQEVQSRLEAAFGVRSATSLASWMLPSKNAGSDAATRVAAMAFGDHI